MALPNTPSIWMPPHNAKPDTPYWVSVVICGERQTFCIVRSDEVAKRFVSALTGYAYTIDTFGLLPQLRHATEEEWVYYRASK